MMRHVKTGKKKLGKPLPTSIFVKIETAEEKRRKAEQIERMIEAKVDQAMRSLLR